MILTCGIDSRPKGEMMAKGKRCPVCGHFTYREWKGNYDNEEWGEGRKLNPDYGRCSYCGFIYIEDIRYSFDEQVMKYKAFIERRTIGYKIKDCKFRIKQGKENLCLLRLHTPYRYPDYRRCPFPARASSINCLDFKPQKEA